MSTRPRRVSARQKSGDASLRRPNGADVELASAPAKRFVVPELCRHIVPVGEKLLLAGRNPMICMADSDEGKVVDVLDVFHDYVCDLSIVPGSANLVAMGMFLEVSFRALTGASNAVFAFWLRDLVLTVMVIVLSSTSFVFIAKLARQPVTQMVSSLLASNLLFSLEDICGRTSVRIADSFIHAGESVCLVRICINNCATRKTVFTHSVSGYEIVSVLALDSDRIMLGCDDDVVRIISASLDGAPCVVQTIPLPQTRGYNPEMCDYVNVLALDKKGSSVLSGSYSGAVHFWHWKTLKHTNTIAERGSPITGLSVSEDFICVAAKDHKVETYSRDVGNPLVSTFQPHLVLKSISLHPHLPIFVSAGQEGTLLATDVVTGRVLWRADLLEEGFNTCEPGQTKILSCGQVATSVHAKRLKRTVDGEAKERVEFLIYDKPACFDVERSANGARGRHVSAPPLLALGVPYVPSSVKRRGSPTLGVPYTPSPVAERHKKVSSASTGLSGMRDFDLSKPAFEESEANTGDNAHDETLSDGVLVKSHVKPLHNVEIVHTGVQVEAAGAQQAVVLDSVNAEAEPEPPVGKAAASQHQTEVDDFVKVGARSEEPVTEATASAQQPGEAAPPTEADAKLEGPSENAPACTPEAGISSVCSPTQATGEAPAVAVGNVVVAPTAEGPPSDATADLLVWASATRQDVRQLRLPQLASALAAFVVDSDPERIAEFVYLRKYVHESFLSRSIGPSSLTGPHGLLERTVMEFVRDDIPRDRWKIGYEPGMYHESQRLDLK